MNDWLRIEREAADKVRALLALPLPTCREEIGDGTFDPWELFPSVYGSYSSEFDDCAIDVLEELVAKKKVRDDLGAEMFREMLCVAELCDYGSSPRVCFASQDFAALLPKLIDRWRDYYETKWN